MTDRGLNTRLRQRSRRAGVMIGVSMAITIALCVLGFTLIYNALDEFTTDFTASDDPTVAATIAEEVAAADSTVEPTQPPENTGSGGEEATAEPTATTEPAEGDNQIQAQPTESTEFTPDYQISAGENVNLRSGPGTDTEPVTSLTSEQGLQYLDESQTSDNPGRDGLSADQEWMKFRTEDGEEGWVRELDVEPYDPDA
jgi:hypothetical protein